MKKYYFISVFFLLFTNLQGHAQAVDVGFIYGEAPVRVSPVTVHYQLINPYWLPADTLSGSTRVKGRYAMPGYHFSFGVLSDNHTEFGVQMGFFDGSLTREQRKTGGTGGGNFQMYGGYWFTRGKVEITPRVALGFQGTSLFLGKISDVGDTLLVGDSLLVKGPYYMRVSRSSFITSLGVAVQYPVYKGVFLYGRASYTLAAPMTNRFIITDHGLSEGYSATSGTLRLNSSDAGAWVNSTRVTRQNARDLLYSSAGLGWEIGVRLRLGSLHL